MSFSWKTITLKELAVIVGKTLRTHGIEAVLVGGACVSKFIPQFKTKQETSRGRSL